jgi:hypothetical protein
MQRSGTSLIQAPEWKFGMPVSSGDFKKVSLLHCVSDGDITAHFSNGDETRSFTAGEDFTLAYVDITVVSGSFDIN